MLAGYSVRYFPTNQQVIPHVDYTIVSFFFCFCFFLFDDLIGASLIRTYKRNQPRAERCEHMCDAADAAASWLLLWAACCLYQGSVRQRSRGNAGINDYLWSATSHPLSYPQAPFITAACCHCVLENMHSQMLNSMRVLCIYYTSERNQEEEEEEIHKQTNKLLSIFYFFQLTAPHLSHRVCYCVIFVVKERDPLQLSVLGETTSSFAALKITS